MSEGRFRWTGSFRKLIESWQDAWAEFSHRKDFSDVMHGLLEDTRMRLGGCYKDKEKYVNPFDLPQTYINESCFPPTIFVVPPDKIKEEVRAYSTIEEIEQLERTMDGSACPKCGAEMRELFTSRYCPECEK